MSDALVPGFNMAVPILDGCIRHAVHRGIDDKLGDIAMLTSANEDGSLGETSLVTVAGSYFNRTVTIDDGVIVHAVNKGSNLTMFTDAMINIVGELTEAFGLLT